MSGQPNSLQSFFAEMKRRRVFRVMAVYGAVAFVVLQLADIAFEPLGLPDWTMTFVVVLAMLGFPIAVVLAWAFESTPDGVRRTAPASQEQIDEIVAQPRFRRWRSGVLALIGMALLFATGWWMGAERGAGESTADRPATEAATTADPAIAVLPFTVRGLDPDIWGEGIVALLSPMLDGVAGIRAINGRTVLARWDERVGGRQADLASSLGVARDVGGRFALVGSAVASGPTARIHLDLHDAVTGERLGGGQLDGPSDDVMALADRAAAEAARSVLENLGRIPDFELEPLTESPEALLAFLEGEVAFRAYELLDARDAYERAIAIDSAFAFAHLRLVEVATWGATISFEAQREHMDAAARHVDRLTERSAIRVRASQASSGVERHQILREALERYPDDAILWYELGESLIHTSAGFPRLDEIRAAFDRALELEPDRPASYPHVVHLAFGESADTARVRRLVDELRELVGEVQGDFTFDADPRIGPFMFDLMFGSPSATAAARSALDTLPPDFLLGAGMFAWNPRRWESFEAVNGALTRHPEADDTQNLSGTTLDAANRRQLIGYALWRGQPGRGLEFASGATLALGPFESTSRGLLYHLHALGIPIPAETLSREFGAAKIDSTSDTETVFVSGAFAVDEERWDDLESAIRELRRRGSSGEPELLRAYGAWRRGDVESAIPVFERHHPDRRLVQWWLGDAYLEAGRFEEAERVFSSYGWNQWYTPFNREPLAQQRLGIIYEALDRPEDAAAAYAYFLEDWEEADPALQPLVEETRRRLEALVGARG
ncbi:MAG: tetratricopeptide repeat protein [Gemmatimonadota bacterium]